MIKHGKKIDKTKKYTYDEAKKLFVRNMTDEYISIGDMFCHIAIMAYEDCKGASTAEFVELLNKYVRDYDDNEFSKTDVRKYNINAIKSFFKR